MGTRKITFDARCNEWRRRLEWKLVRLMARCQTMRRVTQSAEELFHSNVQDALNDANPTTWMVNADLSRTQQVPALNSGFTR